MAGGPRRSHSRAVSLAAGRPWPECERVQNVPGPVNATPLVAAVVRGHTEAVRLLLKAGADVNTATEGGTSALFVAVCKGSTQIAEALIAGGANPNARTQDGKTALFEAALRGHTRIVTALLATQGIQVDAEEQGGNTALLVAAQQGHIEVVRALLAAGANSAASCHEGGTSLFRATGSSHAAVVELLLQAPGININVTNAVGVTPVLVATLRGHTGIVRRLMRAGARLDIPDEDGLIPMWHAASHRDMEMLKAMLQEGGNKHVNTCGPNHGSPVLAAVYNENLEAVRLLLEAGADASMAHRGEFPLLKAAEWKLVDMVQLLLDGGANVNGANEDGVTPLFMAASDYEADYSAATSAQLSGKPARPKRNPDGKTAPEMVATLKALLKADAGRSLSIHAGSLATPLLKAAMCGYVEAVRVLLEAGADVNATTKAGQSALWLAAAHGQAAVVSELLKMLGIQVDAKGVAGRTALQAALDEVDNMEVVKLLVEAGADDSIVDNKGGGTLLRDAAKEGREAAPAKLQREPGASVSAAGGRQGKDALLTSAATYRGLPENIRVTLMEGSYPNFVDKAGKTLLWEAAYQGRETGVHELLAAPEIRVDAADKEGASPLWAAAKQGHARIVIKALLAAGANPNTSLSASRQSALWTAAYRGHLAVVKELLAAPRIQVDAADEGIGRFQTPLFVAAAKGQLEVVCALLKGGAAPDAGDESDRTPLQIAADYLHAEVIKELLQAGANPLAASENGMTAMDVLEVIQSEAWEAD